MDRINVKDRSIDHRLGTVDIVLTDRHGAPLDGAAVRVRQTRHAFDFGCAGFFFERIANGQGTEADDRLAEDWLGLFNTATLSFYWGQFEPERGHPRTASRMACATWLRDRGVKLKGHPLTWHTEQPKWLTNLPLYEIESELRHRIRREVTDFAGVVDMWDALNESVIAPVFTAEENGITKLTWAKGRIEMIRLSVEEARRANPKAFLLLNDFNLSSAYECLIEGCLEAGITLDAIGLQTHMHQGYLGEEYVSSVLDRFARYGLPLHMTENTLVSGHLMPPEIVDLNDYQVESWPSTPEGEARQADEIVRHYRTIVSHPAAENITYWDFADAEAWLGAPAGFIRADGTRKPSYDALHDLIKGQWWISETETRTDGAGAFGLCGFAGEYEIDVLGDDGRVACTIPFSLSRRERGVRTFTVA